MDIFYIALAALAVLVAANLFLVRPLRVKITDDPHTNPVRRHIGFAMGSALGMIASTVLLSCALVFAGLAYIGLRQGTRAAQVEATLTGLQNLRARIQDIEPVIGLMTLGLIVIALLYISFRQSRMRVQNAVQAARAAEFEALAEQARAGTLPDLPPTDAMKKFNLELGKLDAELQNVVAKAAARSPAGAEGAPGQVSLTEQEAQQVSQLRQVSDQLSNLYVYEDFNRRLSGRLREADVALPAPRTVLGKIGTFFISRGHIRSMRFLSKAVFLLGVLLIVPSLLAISAPTVADAMDDRLDQLEDIYVALKQDEARESWAAYRRAADAPVPLSEADRETIQRAAVALEFALAQRAADALKLDAFINRATLRAQGARIRLFRTYGKRVDELGMNVTMRGFAEDADLTDLHRTIVNFELDAAMVPETPSTSAGRAFQDALQEAVPQMPRDQWQAMSSKLNLQWDDFQRLSSRQQLRSLFVTHLMFDGVAPGIPADETVAQFVQNIEDLVPLERRKAMLAGSQAEFLQTLEQQGLVDAVEVVADAGRPHPFGRAELDELFINAQSFAGTDGFDRELRNFSPYLDEVTDARVNYAAAERLAKTMATQGVAEGFQLIDPLASLVQFSDVRSGSGPERTRVTRVTRTRYQPPRRVTSRPSRPRFRFRFR